MLSYSPLGSEPIGASESQQLEEGDVIVLVADSPDSSYSTATVAVMANVLVSDSTDSCLSLASAELIANVSLSDSADTVAATASSLSSVNAEVAVTEFPDTVASTVMVGGALVYVLSRARTVYVHKEKYSGRSR